MSASLAPPGITSAGITWGVPDAEPLEHEQRRRLDER